MSQSPRSAPPSASTTSGNTPFDVLDPEYFRVSEEQKSAILSAASIADRSGTLADQLRSVLDTTSTDIKSQVLTSKSMPPESFDALSKPKQRMIMLEGIMDRGSKLNNLFLPMFASVPTATTQSDGNTIQAGIVALGILLLQSRMTTRRLTESGGTAMGVSLAEATQQHDRDKAALRETCPMQ